MFLYEKKLEYPVNIQKKDLKFAKNLLNQYGGGDGELSAALRYLNQRYTMPDEKGYALLTDIGTEELGHVEIICTMLTQLTKGASIEELKEAGLSENYTMHGYSLFPTDPNGVQFTTMSISSTGNWRADLEGNMAAELRAKTEYEYLMNQTTNPDILAPLSFLRQREVVHYDRFKDLKNYYMKKFKIK